MANPKCLDTSEPSSEFPAEQRTCTRCLKDKSADRSLVLDLDNCSCGESGLAKYIGRRGGSGRMGSSLDGVEASLADRSWNLLEATMEEDTMKGWNFNTEFVASLDNCRVQQKVAAREKRVVALLKAFDEKFDMKDTVATTPVRWTEVDIQFLDLQQRREEQELAQIQEDVRRCNKPRKEEDAVLTSEDERKIIHRAQVDSYLPKINEEDEEQLGARKIAIWHPEVRCQPETLSHLSPEDKGLQDATCQAVNPFHKAVSNEENARSGAWRPEFALPANTGLVALNGATVAPFVAAGTNNIMNKGPTAQCPLARTESICLPADNERLKCTIGNSMCDDDSVYTQSESSLDASDDGSGGTNEGSVLDQSRFLEPFLDTARHALVNKLMQEVWAIFDKAWTAKYTTCGGSVPPSSSPSKERTSTSEGSSIQKRQRQEDDDGNSSGRNNGRRPKRSPPDQRPPDGDERHLELSCPFRKHDPRKYRFPEYKTCARSSWDSVGRVK
jgi:hypothetical protein